MVKKEKGKSAEEAYAYTPGLKVKRAVVVLRPFWRQTFPQDPAAIKVVVLNP